MVMNDKQRRGFFANLRAKERAFVGDIQRRRDTKLARKLREEEREAEKLEKTLSKFQEAELARAERLERQASIRKRIAEAKEREKKAKEEIFQLSTTGKVKASVERGLGRAQERIETGISKVKEFRAKQAKAQRSRPRRRETDDDNGSEGFLVR